MSLFTIIARHRDGLALAADTETNTSNPAMEQCKVTAKNIIRRLSATVPLESPPTFLTVDHNRYYYHIIIQRGVIFVTMSETSFPQATAFAYLEDIAREFGSQYGAIVDQQARPYPFIKFDTYLQKTKKIFATGGGQVRSGVVAGGASSTGQVTKKSYNDVMGYSQRAPSSPARGGRSGKDSTGLSDMQILGIFLGIGLFLVLFVFGLIYFITS